MRRLFFGALGLAIIVALNLSVGQTTLLRASAPHGNATSPTYTPVATPTAVRHTEPPTLSAKSWYALDVDSGVPLAAHDADTERPIASITKLATALVIMHDHGMGDQLTLPQLPTYAPDDEIIHLQAGERFSTHDLLAALLINSADDSADALALADSGTETAFVTKMNQLLKRWGVGEAHFSNPSGLVDTGNAASAKAVGSLAELVVQNPVARQLVGTSSATITDTSGRTIALATTDQLLQNGQFKGIKTGYTEAAGQCFVGLTTIQGHPVITVVLGSTDRFGDTTTLANWIGQNYQWHAPR